MTTSDVWAFINQGRAAANWLRCYIGSPQDRLDRLEWVAARREPRPGPPVPARCRAGPEPLRVGVGNVAAADSSRPLRGLHKRAPPWVWGDLSQYESLPQALQQLQDGPCRARRRRQPGASRAPDQDRHRVHGSGPDTRRR